MFCLRENRENLQLFTPVVLSEHYQVFTHPFDDVHSKLAPPSVTINESYSTSFLRKLK